MGFKITIEDFPLLCRFCLLHSNELEPISKIPSVDIFKIITGIELEDMLPKKICLMCIQICKDFSAFIEKSIQNSQFLKAISEESLIDAHCDNVDCDQDSYGTDGEISSKKQIKKITTKQKGIQSAKPRNKYEKKVKKTFVKRGQKCGTCNGEFPTLKLLYEHYKEVLECLPKNLKLDCKTCGKIFFKKNQLRRHYNESQACLPKPPEPTCQCGISFKTKAHLYAHYKDSPSCQPKDFICLQCDRAFNKKHKLITHIRSHTKETPFECKDCGKKFRFQQNLRRHVLIHEGVKPFKCEVCGKAFSRAHVKNEHMNIHTGNNPYICVYCGKGFKRYANHFIHVYRHKLINGEVDKTENKKLYLQLECNICNKIFASRGGLANHLGLHQEEPRERKFLCYECGKGFVTKAQLESHIRCHTGDRPYECSECNKKFKQKSAYSNHQLVHSGEKPFQCQICDKLFTQSGHLKVHMRVHSGEKPFVCNFCGKSFALKSNLKVHTRIHTGETPYICQVCGLGYYDSTSLKKHMKNHSLSLPSHDHIESKEDVVEPLQKTLKLEDKHEEKVYTRIHAGETPYICQVCGLGYYDSTSLKKHMENHGVDGHNENKVEVGKTFNEGLKLEDKHEEKVSYNIVELL